MHEKVLSLKIDTEMKQGHILSPLLFAVYMESIVKNSNITQRKQDSDITT